MIMRSRSRDGRDASLSDDILKEAEQIRRERNSKRARAQAQANAEAEAEAARLTAAHPAVRQAEAVAGATTNDEGVVIMTGAPRGREDEENKVMIGKVIGEDHVNYVMMYNMLTGIRIGVSCFRCDSKNEIFKSHFYN
jgi:1-phosphatidylinositol-4-phosphate 5-kinase